MAEGWVLRGFTKILVMKAGVHNIRTAREELTKVCSELLALEQRFQTVQTTLREAIEAVQYAIKSAMERYNLELKLVDRGFDYEVALPTSDVLNDVAFRLEVGPYLLEVKATTTGGARLTPTQAETASKEASRYVLCVVDLRECSEEDLDDEWTAAKVEPLAKIRATHETLPRVKSDS